MRLPALAAATTAALALALGALSPSPAATGTPAGAASLFAPRLVTVDTPTDAHKDRLAALGLDLTEHAGHDYVEVVLHTPADLLALVAGGFTFDVRIRDLVRRGVEVAEINEAYAARVARSPLPSGRDTYRTLADYEADMAALARKHRTIVKRFALDRPSLDGRTIYGVEIGEDVRRPASGRPTLVLLGLHHAREWPSGENAMEFAVDLATSYGKDRRITRMLRQARVVVVPVVNVDGFDLSRTDGEYVDLRALNDVDPLGGSLSVLATPGHAYKRKNCRVLDGVDTPDGTCRASLTSSGGFGIGVDLNRNYGGFWGGPGAAASTPDLANVEAGVLDPTYRGAAAFSEPETQNIRDLVRERQVTMLISNHTFGNLILRPNGVNPETLGPDGKPVGDAPDEKALKRLGAAMAANNGYDNIHGWELYDTTGTTEDWSYNATGGFGYTFEIGPDEFHPPFPDVVDQYRGAGKYAGRGNRGAYLVALQHTIDTAHHGVLRGKAPAGTVLRLRKEFRSPTWESAYDDFVDSTITVPRSGRFRWVVNPSTRPVVQPRTYRVDGVTRTTAGKREAYTLTCERRGKVAQRSKVFVDRGQVVRLGAACRR
ncbi:zinc carboxypeptidase [Nocardioides sp. IC4_145]|uniref:zinc carboxypeptidase n=1 Tax=Nocardioides sp. IC4_145 TaxID=2714037 RepID=UPI00140A5A37|nr:zinc carboxypeptidase [Nocardioides sp. IC4_145]NHC24521.1 zinc carboxypeptidase [Nocardioides sp. IC4_145]